MRIALLLLASALLSACAGSQQDVYRFDRGEYNASASGITSLAEQGDPQAQMDLGYLYEHGLGRKAKDVAKARDYYEKASDQGLARADVCLALLLIWSKEVPHDATRAADLLKRADAAGDPYASYYLSYLYSNGNGVPKDEAEGSRLKAKGEPAIDSIMREYSMKMRANIAANQHYPVTAAGHYSGKVQVTFTIEPPFAKDAHVTSSSGHADLDDAAIAAVYQTYYPSLPPGISQPENFVVQINFQ